MMVARKPDHQEERGVDRKTVAQGMPDCSADLWGLACVLSYLHARLRVR
jgi:hypothetical protein